MRLSARSEHRRRDYGTGIATALAAALTAYLLDPRSGGRRRALLRDRFHSLTHRAREFVGKAGRDARHRAEGLYKSSVSRLVRGSAADDSVVEQRVRAELGRLTSHPGPIQVTCTNGLVRLRGDILAREVDGVLRGVRRTRGVRDVVNELRVHEKAGRISALQGIGSHSVSRPELLQANWSPAIRLIAGAAGFTAIAAGLARRTTAGLGFAAGGAALLGRSICNMPLSHLLGIRARDADGVLVQKTIHVHADADRVYDCWRALEGFPKFMSHIREVRKLDDTHYHWVVDGPAGVPVEWDAEVTAEVPRELLAWRTTRGSSVQSYGVVQFEPSEYGGTRIHVRMSYRPPANRVGHSIAKVLGRDPKHQIDADLMRFKSFMETAGVQGQARSPEPRGDEVHRAASH